MAPTGKILVVDHVIQPGSAGSAGKIMDVTMMAITGGRERTRKEFGRLLARARLRLPA